MSQDNNEAASASQSSTPVPRMGGPDEAKSGLFNQFMAEAAKAGITKLDFSHLAHIAPQAAADTGAVVDLILAYGAACTVMDERAPAIMEAIKRALAAVPPARAEGLILPETFVADDLLAVADGLESGYEKTVNVGNNMGMGDEHLESTTAYAARFIRAILAQQAKGATK